MRVSQYPLATILFRPPGNLPISWALDANPYNWLKKESFLIGLPNSIAASLDLMQKEHLRTLFVSSFFF
jgi:hypothetical protein